MNILARKKIVFIIVEGPSDQVALELLLSNMFDKDRVYVHITYGDMTSKYGNNPSNILKKVSAEIATFAKKNHFTKEHFQQVIHIVDTDGAYIPNEYVLEDKTAMKPVYTPQAIKTWDIEGIIERNMAKSRNIDKLSETRSIWGKIPYSVYYMSCNLDHVLHDQLNCSDDEKESNSYAFAKKYRNDKEGFVQFIACSDFSVGGTYRESWKYIKQGRNSLERHTNLGLCFPESESQYFK